MVLGATSFSALCDLDDFLLPHLGLHHEMELCGRLRRCDALNDFYDPYLSRALNYAVFLLEIFLDLDRLSSESLLRD